MGCWYETCGLSGLPITPGDKALLFVLAPGTALDGWQSGFSYPVGAWSPVCPPFFGKYNDDRGTLDFVKKPPAHWPLTKEKFADWNLAWRDDRYDKEWKTLPLTYDYEKFFEPIERGWVRGKSMLVHRRDDAGFFPLGQMLVRQDVWDYLLETPYDAGYGLTSRELTHNHARKFVQYVLDNPPKKEGLSWALSIEDHFMMLGASTFFLTLFRPGESGPSLAGYRVGIMHGLINKSIDPETAREILYDLADLAHVNRMMSHLRRAWGPQTGKGSQDINWRLHAGFLRKAAEIAEHEAKKDEEDA